MSKPAWCGEKYIEITINPDGSTAIEAHGIKDGSCTLKTADYEKALGKVIARKQKSQACNVQKVKRED